MAEELEQIDASCTDEVVCPYCGAEMTDSWEYPDSGEEWCEECDRVFTFFRQVDVHYSSQQVKQPLRMWRVTWDASSDLVIAYRGREAPGVVSEHLGESLEDLGTCEVDEILGSKLNATILGHDEEDATTLRELLERATQPAVVGSTEY